MERAIRPMPATLDQLAGNLLGNDINRHEIVSLFSGCGGMDIGFIGGFKFGKRIYDSFPAKIVYANDIDKYACQAYRENLKHDIDEGNIRDILDGGDFPSHADILLGGFPCQDFSIAGKRKGFGSDRGTLYRAMIDAAARLRPRVFVAENVKGLATLGGALEKIKADFMEAGFPRVEAYPVQCADYGVPQNRERVFIIGWRSVRDAKQFEFPGPLTKRMSVKEAIADLECVGWEKADGHTWALAKRRPDLQGNETTPADGLAYTVRAEHHMNIQFHYELDRRLSVREAARLQTFPDTFLFKTISKNQGYRMVGNAVPPVMAWHVANAVNEVLNS